MHFDVAEAHSKAQLKCPNCSREFVRQVAPVGFKERLLERVSFYPFKCQVCGLRFHHRGGRYIRIEEDGREYERLSRSLPMGFRGEQIQGEGLVLNISMGGCSFYTTSELSKGAIIRLEVRISSDAAPVVVDAAVVRHIYNQTAGVEFIQWQQSERERLQLFVCGLLIGRHL
jgi:hypothetical protein